MGIKGSDFYQLMSVLFKERCWYLELAIIFIEKPLFYPLYYTMSFHSDIWQPEKKAIEGKTDSGIQQFYRRYYAFKEDKEELFFEPGLGGMMNWWTT